MVSLPRSLRKQKEDWTIYAKPSLWPGQNLRRDLLREAGPKLADTVTELVGDDKEAFLDFASGMLDWLPEKRKTAKDLLQHPFFDSFYKDRARDG